MSTTTEEQINHLQSLLDAGTPGHWDGQAGYLTMEDKVLLLGWDKCDEDLENSENNCLLIAKLHNLAPSLLEAARENLRLREALENWNRVYLETECEYDDCQGALNVANQALGKETA